MADYSTVARPYARAIFELARERGTMPAWSEGLAAVAGVVLDETARRFLVNPELMKADCVRFLSGVCRGLDDAAIFSTTEGQNLLEILAENDRLFALPEISVQFDDLRKAAENRIRVTLVSAAAVDSEVSGQVSRALSRRLGREVELELEIDASLLGGAIIRADDMVIDGSVKNRLVRLADTLID
jgi:F-type H+-transporting ATPase subunit delta